MSLDNTIYNRVADEVARNATITVQSGTPDTDYPPEFLVDENPARVSKIGSTSGAWLFDFGSAQRIDIIALIHHTFDAGLDVRIQANASNSWGSPSLNVSLTVPPWKGAGIRRWPTNIWEDLTGHTGYSTSGFRYWRLAILGVNSQNIQLGHVWFGDKIRYLDPDLQWSPQFGTDRLLIETKTSYNISTIYGRGVVGWRVSGQILQDDDLRAELLELWHDTGGREHPFLWIPGPTDEADDREPRMVRFATPDRTMERQIFNLNPLAIALEEVSRGLRPGV